MLLGLCGNLAVFENVAYAFGHGYLTRMMAHFIDLFAEGLYAAVERVETHGRYHLRHADESVGTCCRPYAVSRHELCAVEQREALFRLQMYRLPAQFGKNIGCGAHFALVFNLAHADERQAQMCQRSEVARGAE